MEKTLLESFNSNSILWFKIKHILKHLAAHGAQHV